MSTSTVDLVSGSEFNLDYNKENNKPKKSFREMTIKEKLSFTRELITVEPLIASYVMASILCSPALYALEFEKACKADLNYTDTVCAAIVNGQTENYTDENNNVQILISKMHSWQLPLQSVMPLLLIFFLGSYSDRHKIRKPFLIIPLTGEFLAILGCIFSVIYMREWSLAVQGIAQTVVPSFFGGQAMVVMATFAYIGDVSSLEMRTLRIAVVQITLNLCIPITQSFSGILFATIGYIGMLLIAGCIYAFGIIYVYFFIKEPKRPSNNSDNATVKLHFLADLFNPKYGFETVQLLIKKSPGTNRLLLGLLLLIMVIYATVLTGEATLAYLYVQNVFKWNVVKYSYFTTANVVMHLIGTAVAIPLFTKVFKMSDWLILLVAFLDYIVQNILYLLARTEIMFYLATIVSIITGISTVALRSLGTKVVSENDLGKAQSLFGIFETIGQAIAAPIYNDGIYINTLETYPSAFYGLAVILYSCCCVIILGLYLKFRKDSATNKQEQTNGNTDKYVAKDYQTTHM